MTSKIILWIVASRLHISILFYFIVIGFGSSLDHYLVLSAVLWHYSVYLFDRVYDSRIDNLYQKGEAIPPSYVSSLNVVIVLLLICSFFLFLKSNYNVWYWVFSLPFTFLYTLPLIKGVRIKQILFIKNFYSALIIWSCPIFLIFCIQIGIWNISLSNLIGLFNLFISVLIIEAFWDIRDKEGDRQHNINTIPNKFGVLNTKLYLVCLLVVLFLISYEINFFMALMLIFIFLINEKSPKLYFHLPIILLVLRNLLHF